jgi:hypothetical protein
MEMARKSSMKGILGFFPAVAAAVMSALSLVSTGCHKATPPKYGREFNATRESKKIPIIPPAWNLYSNVPGCITWSNPNGWGPPPKNRLMKLVNTSSDGKLISETDKYFSGRGFKDLDPDAGSPDWEVMIITYEYTAENTNSDPWVCEVLAGPDKGRYKLSDAEAILQKWGVSRLGG